ncbi:interleukin-20 receptor subunit beta [Misgurnus anguillicaudatus]|uniref:interleukin-20 receptor subunit beta n=1 Tax=Misgurnus anguillicaudatus TaxID=75329 RepID=UPI003CCF19AC
MLQISLIKFLLLLIFTINYSSSFSTPLNMSMHSVNMKHILKWTPLSCSTVNYTVQFQGEYELHNLNGSWVNAHDCQEISENKCDLTPDLSSDLDYSIRLMTKCDSETFWTQLPTTFNRRNTMLVAPNMTVAIEGDIIHVGFNTFLPFDITVRLFVSIKGAEQNYSTHVIGMFPYHFSTNVTHRGEKMCFRAEVFVEAINKSCNIDTQCVITKNTPEFGIPVMVSTAVVIVIAVAIILGCSAKRFGPYIKQNFCHREPLPSPLLDLPPKNFVSCMNNSSEQTDPLVVAPA